MKPLLMLGILSWGCVILEQALPDLLPSRSLLLPLVAVGMLWTRRSAGVVTGGTLLVLDWVARPVGLPLLPVVVCFAATWFCSVPTNQDSWMRPRSRLPVIPSALQPMFLVLVGTAVLTMMTAAGSLSLSVRMSVDFLLRAAPFCLLLSGVMLLAAETSWRRTS